MMAIQEGWWSCDITAEAVEAQVMAGSDELARRLATRARRALAVRGFELIEAKFHRVNDITNPLRLAFTFLAKGRSFPPSPGFDADGRECWDWPV